MNNVPSLQPQTDFERVKSLIARALHLFGPMTPLQVKEKLELRGENYALDYIVNVMFLESISPDLFKCITKAHVLEEAPSPELVLYK